MATTVDMKKLEAFLGKVVGDVGASMSSALVVLGDRLGFWRALAQGPLRADELAARTECAERYCREWLDAQAAAGYVTYDPTSTAYTLPPEHAMALAEPDSPAFVPGLFQVTQAIFAAIPAMQERFRTGEGYAWGEQHPCLFEGTERFFRSGYIGNLVSSWIPALDGVQAKLEAGARVADVGCGLGASTIIMAQAFPKSTFIGYDSHPGSIETARKRAQAAGVADRVRFEVGSSTTYPERDLDLVACFDCFHDMEDPEGAARHAKQSLKPDGTLLLVEPFANDRREENHNMVGRVFYSASTMLCVPHSLSQDGPALGAQAGEQRLREVVTGAGFSRFRRATQTPFNLVLEARI
jgi:SAM-dependent methyltransferase